MNAVRPSVPSFVKALEKSEKPIDAIKAGRETLKQFLDYQFDQFDDGAAVAELVKERATFVDQILKKIWQHFIPEHINASLLAVGGYGRGELHPYSDIDVLILTQDAESQHEQFSTFITFLWDLGFDVGHALRSVDECIAAGLEDVATATNLLESRWITGDYSLYEHLSTIWKREDFWPSQAFFQAKFDEQQARHRRFNDTTYQLEPNVKESPGGLRDIQTIYWVAKRHFKASSINQLVQNQFLTIEEYRELEAAYKYLNRVRFALHRMKKRREDRLLFDHQQHIAESFGYKDTNEKMAVEQFMNSYYRNVQNVVKVNEILLQHFREEIFISSKPEVKQVNARFKLVDKYLDIEYPTVFSDFPTALLEVFLILQHYPEIEGIRSHTIRSIRDNLHLIDDNFRRDPINKALFIEIFRQPKGVNAAIRRMHTYGILSAYLPVFAKITGLMQFNIFHAYTVDDHTILVIRNLRRFFVEEYAYEFPTAHQIAKSVCKPEILFLAGLFHDIAKGRGGAHEVLGAEDAKIFAKQHNLSQEDSDLLSWLVRYHLEFSGIAQKKDLSDPAVIHHFAEIVEDQKRLDYLYLLTVADVCATSDEVWNDWKNALFLELYNETTNVLDEASSTPKNRAKKALQAQEKAKEILAKRELKSSDYQPFWDSLSKTEFFSRQTPADIARISKLLYNRDLKSTHIYLQNQAQRGATEVLIYMPDRDFLFAHITYALDKLNLNVMEARIYSTTQNMTLVILYILDNELHSISDKQMHKAIIEKIQSQLAEPEIDPAEMRPMLNSRRIRCFETPTEIIFHKINKHLTELTINTKDIPGLLSRIGCAMKTCNIRIHDAKINTVGEKAEDVFFISDTNNQAITEQHKKDELTEALLSLIEKDA
ncbi:[protein-PII] uridylyltransferase [Thiomicrorhabdus sp. ZW0627]|uniref:[protein-PII] uridylyltransferase n=1 Tax=Thiomicrorhabdus sp. ZW0627 TaxID=3039774 RepID=UPI00243661B0|nr:[protein-PII] uridylyltransferase [Thiomicrorhabdus sp. ZW0627]MDG6773006.1 [protein-PII] uridylyltransferase [Thiomicrorhabdus sp. ZW0627]